MRSVILCTRKRETVTTARHDPRTLEVHRFWCLRVPVRSLLPHSQSHTFPSMFSPQLSHNHNVNLTFENLETKMIGNHRVASSPRRKPTLVSSSFRRTHKTKTGRGRRQPISSRINAKVCFPFLKNRQHRFVRIGWASKTNTSPLRPPAQRSPCRKAEMPYEIVDPRSLSPIVAYNRIFS